MLYKIESIFKTTLRIVFIIVLIVFVINYGFVNWDNVANKFASTGEELAKMVQCEINYKGFHYKGFCSDREDILTFLNNQFNNTGCIDNCYNFYMSGTYTWSNLYIDCIHNCNKND